MLRIAFVRRVVVLGGVWIVVRRVRSVGNGHEVGSMDRVRSVVDGNGADEDGQVQSGVDVHAVADQERSEREPVVRRKCGACQKVVARGCESI